MHEGAGDSHVAVMLYGLTESRIEALVPLARSWNHPAQLMVLEGNVKSRGYDKFQRAYVLECENGGSKVKLELAGSKDKPIVNPAFVFNGWGRKSANLMLKGKKVGQGKDFRLGHRHRPDDSDLIVWVRIELTKPVKISLSPEVSD